MRGSQGVSCVLSKPLDPQVVRRLSQCLAAGNKDGGRPWVAKTLSSVGLVSGGKRGICHQVYLFHSREMLRRVRSPPHTALRPSVTAPRGTAQPLSARSAPSRLAPRCLLPSRISAVFSLVEAV